VAKERDVQQGYVYGLAPKWFQKGPFVAAAKQQRALS